jgi:hypothetical protein
MAETLCLVDSNILIRWVQPTDPDFPSRRSCTRIADQFRRRLLVNYGVSGVQVHDAHLVAAMLVHGVKTILTFNTKDFARFAGIEAVHPEKIARP